MSIDPDCKDLFRSGLVTSTDHDLLDYLPSIVVKDLARDRYSSNNVVLHNLETVALFGDVSGFTALSERFANEELSEGRGAEKLAFHLNAYLTATAMFIAAAGGDIFKFAGDAIIVLWPENSAPDMPARVRLAVEAGVTIQKHLHNAALGDEQVRLSIKVGIGCGAVSVAHLGGVCDSDGQHQFEAICIGPAMIQSFGAEHHSVSGDVVVSSDVWKICSEYCDGSNALGGYWKIHGIVDNVVSKPASLSEQKYSQNKIETILRRARRYVPRAVQPFLNLSHEFWGSEMRRVSVLFVNLGFVDKELASMLDESFALRLNRAFRCVQDAIYMYDGQINKFLVDDKGSTLIAVFGLPPKSHENDAPRSVLAAMALTSSLLLDGLKASVGLTNGLVFCGVVGAHGGRREYTVLGDVVNLSARLMQHAMKHQKSIVCDSTIEYLSRTRIDFERMGEILVKGKKNLIETWSPTNNLHQQHEEHDILANSTTLKNHSCLPDDVLLTSRRRVQSIRTRSIGSRPPSESVQHGRSRAMSSLMHENDEIIASTREMEQTITALEEWRKHTVRAAGSHSSLTRRTETIASKMSNNPCFLDDSAKDQTNPVNRIMEHYQRHVDRCGQDCAATTPGTTTAAAATHVIIVEGQVGIGKTNLLAKVAIACTTLLAKVVAVAANPFEKGILLRPYGIWQDIVEALLIDEEIWKERDGKNKLVHTHLSATGALTLRQKRVFQEIAKVHKTEMTLGNKNQHALVVEGPDNDSNDHNNNNDPNRPGETKTVSPDHQQNHHNYGQSYEDQLEQVKAMNTVNTMTTREKILARWNGSNEDSTAIDHPHVFNCLFATNFVVDSLDQAKSRGKELEYLLEPTPLENVVRRGERRSSVENRQDPRIKNMTHYNRMASRTDFDTLLEQEDDTTDGEKNQTTPPTTDETTDELSNDLVAAIITRILNSATRTKPILILVDDCHALDNKAWEVAVSIAERCPKVFLVMSTRPMVLKPQAYKQLNSIDLKHVVEQISLNQLHDTVIKQLVKDELDVNMIPGPLLHFICQRARGNPLFAKEFTQALLNSGTITVDSSTRSVGTDRVPPIHDEQHNTKSDVCMSCERKFNLLHHRYMCRGCGQFFCNEHCSKMLLNIGYVKIERHCLRCFNGEDLNAPPSNQERKLFEDQLSRHVDTPLSVQCVIGMMIDTLPYAQQLVLKTASVLGHIFRLDEVIGIYPKPSNGGANDEQLRENTAKLVVKEILHMEQLGFIAKIEPIHEATSPIKMKQKYTFVVDFMAEVFTSRMLDAQKAAFAQNIKELRGQRDMLMMKQFMSSSTSSSNTMITRRLKSGYLLVRTLAHAAGSGGSGGSGGGGGGSGGGGGGSGGSGGSGGGGSGGGGGDGDGISHALPVTLKPAKKPSKFRRSSQRAKSIVMDKLFKPVQRRASTMLSIGKKDWKKRWVIIESHFLLVFKDDKEQKLLWKIPLKNLVGTCDLLDVRVDGHQNVLLVDCNTVYRSPASASFSSSGGKSKVDASSYSKDNGVKFWFTSAIHVRTAAIRETMMSNEKKDATGATKKTEQEVEMLEWNDALKYSTELAQTRNELVGKVSM